jgi:osmotically-inducible protein OsmY
MKKLQNLALALALCLAGTGLKLMAQSTSDQNKSQPQTSNPQTPENQSAQPAQSDVDKNAGGTQIEQQIQSAFQQDPQSAYSNVRVQARDNEIVLSGTVPSKTAKEDAESIAKQYAGGRKVKNEIHVKQD